MKVMYVCKQVSAFTALPSIVVCAFYTVIVVVEVNQFEVTS